MGQAKRRGTLEQRQAQGEEKQREGQADLRYKYEQQQLALHAKGEIKRPTEARPPKPI